MKDLKYILLILVIIVTSFIMCQREKEKFEDWKKKEIIKNDSLVKIDSTQYTKVIADTLTEKQLRNKIRDLEIALRTKPKTVIETQLVPYPVEKRIDSIVYVDGKLNLTDYYPQKKDYFVRYTAVDTIGRFDFNPIKMSLVLSEDKDGVWRVDSKVPSFLQITDITAVGVKGATVKKRSPFYAGGGIQKQNDKYPLSVLGGFRVNNTIIFGGVNTEGQIELKTLYNF